MHEHHQQHGKWITGTFANSGTGFSGGGMFSAQLQTFTVPSLASSYSGNVGQSPGGSGTISMSITQSGAFFSGTGATTFPSHPSLNGTGQFVGFVSNATTAQFAILPQGNAGNCSAFGTVTISGNQLSGTYRDPSYQQKLHRNRFLQRFALRHD